VRGEGDTSDGLSPCDTRSQVCDRTGGEGEGGTFTVAPGGMVTTPHGAPVVRNLGQLPGVSESLMTVREVATRLLVSTATVYALCDRGDLPHLRVSNAIRIVASDLAAFIAARRGLDQRS
jgi:excisionase family DNA binding protein